MMTLVQDLVKLSGSFRGKSRRSSSGHGPFSSQFLEKVECLIDDLVIPCDNL